MTAPLLTAGSRRCDGKWLQCERMEAGLHQYLPGCALVVGKPLLENIE